MNRLPIETSLDMIIDQSQVALDAIGELNFSLSNLNRLAIQSHLYLHFHNEVFHSIEIFINTVNTISLMLWPEMAHRKRKLQLPHDNLAIRKIKERMNIHDAQKFRNKLIRNYGAENIAGSNVSSSQYDKIGYLVFASDTLQCQHKRHYDPVSRNFYSNGETCNIQDMSAIIVKLLAFAMEEKQKQKARGLCESIPCGILKSIDLGS